MICYKDMTFCAAMFCLNDACPRHKSHVPDDGSVELPVAWADFSQVCEDYSFSVRSKDKVKDTTDER